LIIGSCDLKNLLDPLCVSQGRQMAALEKLSAIGDIHHIGIPANPQYGGDFSEEYTGHPFQNGHALQDSMGNARSTQFPFPVGDSHNISSHRRAPGLQLPEPPIRPTRQTGNLPNQMGQNMHQPCPSRVDSIGSLRDVSAMEMYQQQSQSDLNLGQSIGASAARMPPGLDAQQMVRLQEDGLKDDDDKFESYRIDLDAVESGADQRTTCMIRNIPNQYTQRRFETVIDHQCPDILYNFLYVPVNTRNRRNVGYGFINFEDPKAIIKFHHCFHGCSWKDSGKICEIAYARLQGLEALAAHFSTESAQDRSKGKPLFNIFRFPSKNRVNEKDWDAKDDVTDDTLDEMWIDDTQ
jgi:hypothetical protein